jgi:hypothetical protein
MIPGISHGGRLGIGLGGCPRRFTVGIDQVAAIAHVDDMIAVICSVGDRRRRCGHRTNTGDDVIAERRKQIVLVLETRLEVANG